MSRAWKQRLGMPVVAVATVVLLALFLPPLGRVVAQSSSPVHTVAQASGTVAGASPARAGAPPSRGSLANTGRNVVALAVVGLFLIRMGILVRRMGED